MINDYNVQIKYKNKNNESVGERVFPFVAYTSMVSGELKRCLNDIEDSMRNKIADAKAKAEYDGRNDPEFMNIRKQILDAANAIERLPETMYCEGVPIRACKASTFISNMIDNM